MTEHVIRRGLDIPIAGAASGDPVVLDLPDRVVIDPREFRGVIPRLVARAGDTVGVGSPLFTSKGNADLQYLSPVAGRVADVLRGHRRVITGIVVEVDRASSQAVALPTATEDALAKMSRDEIVALIQRGGLWWSLRQRPLDRVADASDVPQAIVVCATETGPLQPGPDQLLADGAALRLGLAAVRRLTDGTVYLTTRAGTSHPALQGLTGVEVRAFRGPHPAGDPVVQVNHLCPPRGNGRVWYLHAWEVERIGRLLQTGRYPGEKIAAAVGAGVAQPRFVRTVQGAPLGYVVGAVKSGDARWIRGSVLTGATVTADDGLGWYTAAVHVLPAEVPRRLFGWMMPSFGQYSVHRAFPQGWFRPSAPRDLRPGVFGGHRGLVPVDQYRRVVATPDIEPEFLMKALASGNLEESIQLGLLDLSAEEAALCTYVCPSKIEFDELLRKGLELYEQEI
jgi:Na+-transporting NADH:ubiquinone oxidoreductase subunit A